MNSNISMIKNLEYMLDGQIREINNSSICGYLHKAKGKYCVAIEDTVGISDFEEKFVGITITTNYINIPTGSKKVLYMYIPSKYDLSKFAYIAENFMSIENRNNILNNTAEWIDSWRRLFGDTVKKKKVFDVIGEMVIFRYLYSIDKTAVWAGPTSGSQDIVMKNRTAEVKSTTIKVGNVIHINSAFQLDPQKPSDLFFVRLEQKDFALTIDSLANDIINLGYDSTLVENNLSILGYPAGNKDRKKSFSVLEIKKYEVNDLNFPIISLQNVNSLTKSNNIIGYTLTVDLTNINGENITV